MGFFNRKKKEDNKGSAKEAKTDVKVEKKVGSKPVVKAEKKKEDKKVEKKVESKPVAKTETKKSEKKSEGKIKGANSAKAYEVLLKPLITEKASELGALNKYVFAINPRMNKIEVKKAIRTLYQVDPVGVNIINLSGRKVRYGRISGKTKSWKKAIVTLKEGDSIEVYEGV